ncbi:MAG: YraN family protein [Candidatus Paceibacterota bacterium]|jgi:putative endonuclease
MFGRISKKQIGNLGEGIACNFLIKKDFLILARNYWKKWGEIDIVAEKGEITHFVEVKTVSRENSESDMGKVPRENLADNSGSYRAEDNVHPWKLKRLSRTIQSYLLEKNFSDYQKWQFDVITVQVNLGDKRAKIKHLEDIILS